jgi:hypothetical protein
MNDNETLYHLIDFTVSLSPHRFYYETLSPHRFFKIISLSHRKILLGDNETLSPRKIVKIRWQSFSATSKDC